MDVGKSLTYVFEDERWPVKLGIAGALVLLAVIGSFTIVVPVAVGVLLVGYSVAILRNVRDGMDRPLPEWQGFGELFVDGLRLAVAQFVWSIPILALYVPLFLLTVITDQSRGSDMGAAGGLLLFCGYCVIGLYGLFVTVVSPAIYVAYARRGAIGDALDVPGVLRIVGDRLGDIVLILIVTFVVTLFAGLGLLLCFIGIAFTSVWATFVQSHLYGQLAARARPGGAWPEPGQAVPPAVPPAPPGATQPEDVVSEVRERGEEALRSLDDTTVYVDDPSEEPPGEPDDEPA